MRASKLLFLYASRNDLRKHAKKNETKIQDVNSATCKLSRSQGLKRTDANVSVKCIQWFPIAKQEVHSCIEVSQLLLSSVERSACCTKSNAAGRKHIAPHMSNQAWRRLKASKPGMNQDLNEIQCLEFEHDSKHDLSWRCMAFAAGDVANRTTKLQRKLCKLRADVHAISPPDRPTNARKKNIERSPWRQKWA